MQMDLFFLLQDDSWILKSNTSMGVVTNIPSTDPLEDIKGSLTNKKYLNPLGKLMKLE